MEDWLIIDIIEDVDIGKSIPCNYEKSNFNVSDLYIRLQVEKVFVQTMIKGQMSIKA